MWGAKIPEVAALCGFLLSLILFMSPGVSAAEFKRMSQRELVNSPAVNSFVMAYIKEVEGSPQLKKLFSVGKTVTPEDFADGLFILITYTVAMIGDKNAVFDARYATKLTTASFDQIPYEVLMPYSAQWVGKYLLQAGGLNDGNAADLAKKLSKALVDISTVVVDDKIDLSVIPALVLGYENFLRGENLFTADTMKDIKDVLGNEWVYLAMNRTNTKPKKVETCPTPILQRPKPELTMQTNEDKCYNPSPALSIFSYTLAQKVLESKELSEVVDLAGVTQAEHYRGTYFLAQLILIFMNANNSAALADFGSRYSADLQNTLPVILRTAAHFVGGFLDETKMLTPDNAEDMADKLAKAIQSKVSAKIFTTDCPRAKIAILFAGIVDFLKSNNFLDQKYVQPLAFNLGNSWFCEQKLEDMQKCGKA